MPVRNPIFAGICLAAAFAYRFVSRLLHSTVFFPRKELCCKVVVVGSFLAGGAGKTPLTRAIAEKFPHCGKRVAVLCHSAAWDEFEMLRSIETGAQIFKTSNRYRSALQLQNDFDVILCDGGLEDTRFCGAKRLSLRWKERAEKIADLIPAGKCVSLERDHADAENVRCARAREKFLADENVPEVRFGIGKIQNCLGENLGGNRASTLLTAIGNPERFECDLLESGVKISRKKFLPDHSKKFAANILQELSKSPDAIVLSEKDFARLDSVTKKNPRIFVAKEIVVWNSAMEKLLASIFIN